MAKTDKPLSSLTYEQAFQELLSIVETMENRQQSLDEAMQLFERGQALSQHCASLLEEADLRISELTAKPIKADKEE